MIAVDTSVLAFAANRFAPEHPRAVEVLESLADGELPWALAWPAAHEFLERVTHPHGVVRPLRAADAWAFLAALRQSPTLHLLGPTARHADIGAEVLELAADRAGTLPPGFAVAVVLREHGVRELLTADAGMRRYRFLDVRDPFHASIHDSLHEQPWRPGERPGRRYRTLRPRTRG